MLANFKPPFCAIFVLFFLSILYLVWTASSTHPVFQMLSKYLVVPKVATQAAPWFTFEFNSQSLENPMPF
jgi:hypothetical protein